MAMMVVTVVMPLRLLKKKSKTLAFQQIEFFLTRSAEMHAKRPSHNCNSLLSVALPDPVQDVLKGPEGQLYT